MYAVDEAIGIVGDMTDKINPSIYISMYPEIYGHSANGVDTEEGKHTIKIMRERFVKHDLPIYLKHFETLLARNGNRFLASSEKPSIAGCYAVPSLRSFTRGYLEKNSSNCLDDHPLIVDYIRLFCALPEIHGRFMTRIY